MQQSVSDLVLRARQLEREALEHLAQRIALADVIGQLIHALQHERGATSIYLASGGERFASVRQEAAQAIGPITATLQALCGAQQVPANGASAQMLSLMAWVLLDLDMLEELRPQMAQRTLTAHDAVAAFSRVIAGLVELTFEVADTHLHPDISRLLVGFFHLVQGKEAAGQERAVGAQLFASGSCSEAQQLRITHLIDAQERSLQVFEEFAEPPLRAQWQHSQLTPQLVLLERLRRTLCTARHGGPLEQSLSEAWFEVCSERITGLWQLQEALVQCLRQTCARLIAVAEQDLLDSEGLLRRLRDNPPPHTHAVQRFFDPTVRPGAAPVLPLRGEATQGQGTGMEASTVSGLMELVHTQSERLAGMELELDTARRAMQERKVIERAKGALMSRLGLSEEVAYRALQKASMDHNRRLVDVAHATLSLPDCFFQTPTSNAPVAR